MMTRILLSAAMCFGIFTAAAPTAEAGPDPYIGEIMAVGFNFCPRGWAAADGQIMSINNNMALFSLYGTTYGGDGRTTFALPDLRGRTPIHAGTGPGLNRITMGQRGGTEIENPKSSGLTGIEAEDGERLASAQRPVNNRAPYTAVKYCVAMTGVFPSRT